MALALIFIELWPFSAHNLSKSFFFFFFGGGGGAGAVQLWNNWSSKWPPQEELNSKNAQFLQWILKDDDVYFKKTTAS